MGGNFVVKIKCDIFEFEFKSHVSVISGSNSFGTNSGDGKTRLFEKLHYRYLQDQIISNKKLIFLNSYKDIDTITISPDSCIFYDEYSFAPTYSEQLMQNVKSANAYLICFGRLDVQQIEYGIQDVYFTEERNHRYSLRKIFHPINKPAVERADIIVTEDSKSVAGLYSALLGENVIGAGSKNNIWKYIKTAEYPLIIADEHKFTPALMKILLKNKHAKKLYLFLPASFEEILLDGFSADAFRDVSRLEEAFDSELYCENYINDLCSKFNKDHVTSALRCLLLSEECNVCKFHLKRSQVLRALIDFYSQNDVQMRFHELCYEIDLTNFREHYLMGNESMRLNSSFVPTEKYDFSNTKISKESHINTTSLNSF